MSEGTTAERPPDEAIIQQLGTAVLLCWQELAHAAQEKILAQAEDMIALVPMPDARDRIIGLLLRRARCASQHDNSQKA
jgi:hypothetical protein